MDGFIGAQRRWYAWSRRPLADIEFVRAYVARDAVTAMGRHGEVIVAVRDGGSPSHAVY